MTPEQSIPHSFLNPERLATARESNQPMQIDATDFMRASAQTVFEDKYNEASWDSTMLPVLARYSSREPRRGNRGRWSLGMIRITKELMSQKGYLGSLAGLQYVGAKIYLLARENFNRRFAGQLDTQITVFSAPDSTPEISLQEQYDKLLEAFAVKNGFGSKEQTDVLDSIAAVALKDSGVQKGRLRRILSESKH